MNSPLFSLILATYGRVDELARLLDSLEAQVCRDFELIVADQNPDGRVEPFVARARQAGVPVQHLKLAQPNLSAARNAGLRVAQGQWFAIPDDDCWYEADTLGRVRQRLIAPAPVDAIAITWVEQVHKVRPEDDTPLQWAAWRRFKGSDASSITLFANVERVRQLGGFDERMGVGQWFGSGEETDLVLRLLAGGAKVERLLDARVHHAFGTPSTVAFGAAYRQSRNRARGFGALCAKHKLPIVTTWKGLLGPALWPVLRPSGVPGVARALGVLVGRWQGLFGWRQRHGS